MGFTTSNTEGALDHADLKTPLADTPHTLPDKPLVVIEPRAGLGSSQLGEVWAYRELLYFLTWRDVKVRYKQTLLGVLWVVLQPLFMMIVFTLFFGRLVGPAPDGVPYPLFAFAGVLPWTFFAAAASASGHSMVNSANLISKVYFPRLIVPAAAVGAALVDFAVGSVLLVVLMVYFRVGPTPGLLMLPVLVVLVVGLALGFGTLMAALSVKYRDVKHTLPFIVQLWFFVSPIVYPVSLLPESWRWAFALNPMAGIIEGFRSALYGGGFDWPALAASAAFTVALLVCAVATFRRMERGFADVI